MEEIEDSTSDEGEDEDEAGDKPGRIIALGLTVSLVSAFILGSVLIAIVVKQGLRGRLQSLDLSLSAIVWSLVIGWIVMSAIGFLYAWGAVTRSREFAHKFILTPTVFLVFGLFLWAMFTFLRP